MAKMQVRMALLFVSMGCMMMMMMSSVVEAVHHRVGDKYGWQINPNPNYFAEWAQGKTFHVGDKLEFDFRNPGHNVLVVDKNAYDTCSQNFSEIKDWYYYGPATVELTKPGDYYFLSGIGLQCEVGVKLHVKVV